MNYFIAHVPFQYFTFKSIYEQLQDSYFIIPPFSDTQMTFEYGSGMSAKGLYEYLYDFLRKNKVRVADYGERNIGEFIDFLNKNAKNVITSHTFTGIHLLHNVRIIRLMYGLVNKDSSTYCLLYNFLMDLVLTYGPNSEYRFKENGIMAMPIGNPIFDDWFNKDISEYESRYIERRLDDKPTILYLPTWSRFSGVERFLDSIISLFNDFNVIVKLHHITFNGEANRLCKLLSCPELIVLGDYIDPQILYKLADIVLVDNSGAIYDALLLKKPVIILGASLGADGDKIYDERDRTYSVEKSDIIPSTNQPEELKALIENNIGKSPKLEENFRYSMFFSTDGKAGKRAVDIIINDKKFPAIPTLEKYNTAIKNVPSSKDIQIIEDRKKDYLKRYYPEQINKPSLASRIYRRFFK